MTDLINSSEITVAGKKVTVFEMTTAQIRQWLIDTEKAESGDYVGDLLFDDFAISDLTRMSTIKNDQLSEMVPSQIRYLADICKEKNEFFFALVGKRRKMLDKALGLLDNS